MENEYINFLHDKACELENINKEQSIRIDNLTSELFERVKELNISDDKLTRANNALEVIHDNLISINSKVSDIINYCDDINSLTDLVNNIVDELESCISLQYYI